MTKQSKGLKLEDYKRYGRQMILPEIGKQGQMRLRSCSVLIVGLGGLGCPAIAYLAGAGVGKLGLIDEDTVDLSNCHRQILYREHDEGCLKASTAAKFINNLNANVETEIYTERLNPGNIRRVFVGYDLVLDCCDNQTTRYLVSDVCVVLGLPLVSGSALKTDGQLAVYNYNGGPCYRCIFPRPSPIHTIDNCSNSGILGPVVGVIGVLQALEAIKIIVATDWTPQKSVKATTIEYTPRMTIFSAYGDPQWRSIKLRSKKSNCETCGSQPSIDLTTIQTGSTMYADHHMLPRTEFTNEQRINACDVARIDPLTLILDVRDEVQFEIVSLPRSVNVPLSRLDAFELPPEVTHVLFVCRYGNDSQQAASLLAERFPLLSVKDLRGGLQAYSEHDKGFPSY